MTIVSLSINDNLLKKFDDMLKEKGFATRSEAFRDVIRSFVNESEWEKGFGENLVVITLIHSKETPKHDLLKIQHTYEEIHTMLHTHLDETNCLEVYIVKGSGSRVKQLIKSIRKIKGVKQVEFVTSVSNM